MRVNSQSCPESPLSARPCGWKWCTTNNELRTTSGRRVIWVDAHANAGVLETAATGRRQRLHLWARTIAEGHVGWSEGCQTARGFECCTRYVEWLGVPAKPDADVCNIYQQLALNYATPSATRGWGPWRRPQAAAARAVDYRSHGQPVWRRGPRRPRVAPPPPPPAGAPPLPTGVLAKLKELVLLNTQVTDAAAALPSPPRSTAARCLRSSDSFWTAYHSCQRRIESCRVRGTERSCDVPFVKHKLDELSQLKLVKLRKLARPRGTHI